MKILENTMTTGTKGITLLLCLCTTQFVSAQPPKNDAPAPVLIERATLSSKANRQTFIGTLTPIRTSTVGSAVDGRIVEMPVELGEHVEMDFEVVESSGDATAERLSLGQKIATIDSAAIAIQIMAAKVELTARQQALEEMKISLPQDIALAQALLAQAQAELVFAKENFDRLQLLVSRGGGISEREIAEARSIFLTRQQSVQATETSLRKLELTRQIKLDIAETAVRAHEKAVERLTEELGRHTIRAPFAGGITAKMADIGDWVSRGTPIVQIVQMDPIELTIQVAQAHLADLQAALDASQGGVSRPTAHVTIEGYSESLEGTVWAIVPQADLRTRSFPVVIRIPNRRGEAGYLLKPGMLARTTIDVSVEREVVLINKDALLLESGTVTVMLAVASEANPEELVAKPVNVTIGKSFGGSIEILSGVSAGQQVIVQGNERVRPGQKLKVFSP